MAETAAQLLAAVREGLARSQKALPSRFFYDVEGSRLFEEICELPEYYLTRAEEQILADHADDIAAGFPPDLTVIELGSGSARKTRLLLDALLRAGRRIRYVPVDISEEMLDETVCALSRDYPGIDIEPITAEYGVALERLRSGGSVARLVLFLGSNLGNFTPQEATGFLRQMRGTMSPGDHALLGLDLRKDPSVLLAAYDDAQGVTARFNLNLLRRINRELNADFDTGAFTHRAVYNDNEGRIEMHLVSRVKQTVTVAGEVYRFEAGESIHTENSYKYSREQIEGLAASADMGLERSWLDREQQFSANLLLAS